MLGLWLERWNANWQHDEIEILNFLAQSYAAAWEKFDKPSFFGLTLKHPVITALCASSLLLLFIKIPLPVSAPCEVIASSPVVVTAPLEGIIKDVDVEPGQSVVKDEVLFQYDKRVPLEELNVAMKEVEMVEAEMKKTNALALKDKKALEQLGLLALKLKKEKTELSLAQYKASQLVVKSPLTGVVMFDNPEQWRGNPVKVGEKIMTVSDPRQTKVRLWIPENDNIDIEMGRPIKVVLNVEPDVSYAARLVYIANSSALNEKGLPSFLADAEWEGAQPTLKLGLKGNAIIYGKDVTIFYWLIRRPLTYARSVLGF
jgi:multidrug resistance efflux pump